MNHCFTKVWVPLTYQESIHLFKSTADIIVGVCPLYSFPVNIHRMQVFCGKIHKMFLHEEGFVK